MKKIWFFLNVSLIIMGIYNIILKFSQSKLDNENLWLSVFLVTLGLAGALMTKKLFKNKNKSYYGLSPQNRF